MATLLHTLILFTLGPVIVPILIILLHLIMRYLLDNRLATPYMSEVHGILEHSPNSHMYLAVLNHITNNQLLIHIVRLVYTNHRRSQAGFYRITPNLSYRTTYTAS